MFFCLYRNDRKVSTESIFGIFSTDTLRTSGWQGTHCRRRDCAFERCSWLVVIQGF